MSRVLDITPKQAFYAAAGVAVGAGFAYGAYSVVKKVLDNRIPKKWKKVGEVSDLYCFPIKSCGLIRIAEFECSQIGLVSGNLRDRIFMVIKSDSNEFITARGYPTLWQITPTVKGDIMTLSAPGMMDIQIDFNKLRATPSSRANVWGEDVDVIDAGEEAAQWFSRFILKEDFGLRLVYYRETKPTRDVRPKNKIFETAIPFDTGALHDATSFNLINEGSMADLNSKLKNPITPLNFRPNIVIKGPEAYAEDNWKWVKIGETVFRNVKPCTRCIFTTIDPETAVKNPDGDPITTLKKYRLFKKTGASPVLGIHLGLRGEGKIKLNDPVFVEDE